MDTTITLTAVAESGWNFDNWGGDLTGTNNPATITISSDISVTANFSQVLKINEHENSITKIYPNPISNQVNIDFQLSIGKNVDIKIVNISGAVIDVINNRYYNQGYHTITWNAKDDSGNKIEPGIYLCKITLGKSMIVSKLTILR